MCPLLVLSIFASASIHGSRAGAWHSSSPSSCSAGRRAVTRLGCRCSECWVSATTAEGELTRRYQGGCEVAGSWVTLDTEAGTTAGGGVGAWLLYRGGENALYTPGLAPAHHKLSLTVFTGEAVSWRYPDLCADTSWPGRCSPRRRPA